MAGARLKPRDNSKVGELVPFAPSTDAESAGPNQVPDLGPVVAARLERWCAAYGLPPSTLRAIISQGQGPDTFRLGKLIFITREAWETWLAEQAAKGGTGRLSPPTGRTTLPISHNTARGY